MDGLACQRPGPSPDATSQVPDSHDKIVPLRLCDSTSPNPNMSGLRHEVGQAHMTSTKKNPQPVPHHSCPLIPILENMVTKHRIGSNSPRDIDRTTSPCAHNRCSNVEIFRDGEHTDGRFCPWSGRASKLSTVCGSARPFSKVLNLCTKGTARLHSVWKPLPAESII